MEVFLQRSSFKAQKTLQKRKPNAGKSQIGWRTLEIKVSGNNTAGTHMNTYEHTESAAAWAGLHRVRQIRSLN